MGKEVERKFLVQGYTWRKDVNPIFCRQGYLFTEDKKCIIRIRVIGDQAYLTIKGGRKGISKLEYEYPLPIEDANELMEQFCEKPFIEKKDIKFAIMG